MKTVIRSILMIVMMSFITTAFFSCRNNTEDNGSSQADVDTIQSVDAPSMGDSIVIDSLMQSAALPASQAVSSSSPASATSSKPLKTTLEKPSVAMSSKQFKKSKKKALLIGISDYKYAKEEQWDRLASLNDIDMLNEVLTNAGFTVTTLVNEKATHDGIENALKELASQCESDDIVLVHFSGHGQQIEGGDQSNEPDHKTENFLAYGARKRYIKGIYEGKEHFTDDEIYYYKTLIRQIIGPKGSLMMTFDSCHSGSSSRGSSSRNKDDVTRGIDKPFKNDNFKPVKRITATAPMSPFIELSAGQDKEVNFEYIDKKDNNKHYGSLSYLLALALKSGKKDFESMSAFVMSNYKSSGVMTRQRPQKE